MKEENQKLYNEMVAIANSYKNSSEVLNMGNQLIKFFVSRKKLTINGRPIQFDAVILSRIVLLAIQIEISLKSLSLADNDVVTREHDWVTLFSSLSTARQQEIVNKMPQEFQTDFMNLLTTNKDSFIHWRYSYEHNDLTCDWSFVNALANTLASITITI